jgi:hypothetical protein
MLRMLANAGDPGREFGTTGQATNAVALGQADAMSADSPKCSTRSPAERAKLVAEETPARASRSPRTELAVNKGDKLGKRRSGAAVHHRNVT